MALTYSPETKLGTDCPDFELPGVDGNTYTLANFKSGKPFLVMFICNHCPYVKAIEERLLDLGHYMKSKNIPVVAICPNDGEAYPEDSFENLKRRAIEKDYPFPYLVDDKQVAAKAFSAVCTPDFFLYDKNLKLAYRGRLDDSWKDSSRVSKHDLKEAVDLLAAGKSLQGEQIPTMGCSIKWKS